MQITHEEARELVQLNADEALNAQEKNTLSAHLKVCTQCRAYAEQIKEVEDVLLPLMKKQWNLQPIPLSLAAISLSAKRISKTQASIILATRSVAIGIVFLAFIFSAWQFAFSDGQTSSQLPGSILPVPTPSAESTSTKITPQKCAEMFYTAQEGDTLESIAQRFAVAKEEIMAINNLKTERIATSIKLMIPICNFTPTGTVNPTLFSTTYTPSISPVLSTPGG